MVFATEMPGELGRGDQRAARHLPVHRQLPDSKRTPAQPAQRE
jgi:hypothetical protein